ncbi:MAG: cadmium-translocating P-type ATPase [Elusimicrobiota bacterium]|jgi:Cd2+/Zn2+-exporting ATPase|nr:cadmium-translocating P-type ATPase [Elusimicrobiota bacterium]
MAEKQCCCKSCGQKEETKDHKTLGNICKAVGVVFYFLAIFVFSNVNIKLAFFIAAYLLIGFEIIKAAVLDAIEGELFNENFLMCIATIGAFAIGDYPEAVAVMLFFQIGLFLEEFAVGKSKKSISKMMDIRPDYANLKVDGDITKVDPKAVKIGDIIVVKAGEQIPLDGVVVDGQSIVDVSALTGESLPQEVYQGCDILSGSINKTGLIEVRVTKTFGQSTVSKILELLENSSKAKSKTEHFIRKFAKVYTPCVIALAVLVAAIPPLLFADAVFKEWLYRALLFLVISCPCALVVSIPLSFFGAIGASSKEGILIKGGNFLEALNSAKTFVFDKTGTLTKGVFEVSEIITQNNFNAEYVLKMAAHAEHFSNHPIALSSQKAFKQKIDKTVISNYQESAGLGINANVGGNNILAGSKKFLEQNNIGQLFEQDAKASVYIASDGVFAGVIKVSDTIKPDSKKTIDELNKIGQTVMLSGDSQKICKEVGAYLNVGKVYGGLLPDEKVKKLQEIKKAAVGNVVFAGDGINDAPVLANADISIAMGALGSDAAIEAADIVLMTDEPSKILTALAIAKKTKKIVWQNIIFIMGVKSIFLVLGAMGIAAMWNAIFADVGVAVIATLNSIRTLGKNK